MSFQVLSQFLCLLPWPLWYPSLVGIPGLPPPMQFITAEGSRSPLSGLYISPAFKFQPRCETVDWRRISAVDVDRVIRDLDLATLQENIAGITFCNFDREACRRCGHPVDPALLKVLRLAQLIIEYLVYCQECLNTNITKLEAQLQVSVGQQERGQKELDRQTDELKGMREECHRRHKMINTLQQMLLQTGAHNYHMCHLCDKIFMNSTFLWNHIQRRHGNMAEAGKLKKQGHPLEDQLEELRTKLKLTQGELEAQKEAERRRQCQEAEFVRQREREARERETRKEFDGWIEKERANLHMEIDKLKKLFWDEFKNVAHHNATLEQGLQTHSMRASNLGSLQDEEPVERRELAQILQLLTDRMKIQETEWTRKTKELQEKYAAQKRELQEEKERLHEEKERLQEEKESLYEEKERLTDTLTQDKRKDIAEFQHQIKVLHAKLKEQNKVIISQEEQIQTIFLRKIEALQQGAQAVHTQKDSSEKVIHQGPQAVHTKKDSSEKVIHQGLQAVHTKKDSSKKAIHQGLQAVHTKDDSSKKGIHQGPQAMHTEKSSSEKGGSSSSFPLSEEAIRQDPQAVDTEEDFSEEDLEDSQDEQQKVLATLKQKHILVKHFRVILEETLQEKLNSVGIKQKAKGIKTQVFRRLKSLLKVERAQKAANFPEFLSLRKKLAKEIASKMKEREGNVGFQRDSRSPAKRQQSSVAFQKPQPKARTQYIPSPSKPAEPHKATPQSLGSRGPDLARVPSSTRHHKAQKRSNSSAAPEHGLSSTPPFSSEEDFGGESMQHMSGQPLKVPPKRCPDAEDDWDWSESGSSEGRPQAPDKGSGGLASSETLVQLMVKSLEEKLEAPVKKPAGGVSLFSLPKTRPSTAALRRRTSQQSDDESELEISFLEDAPQNLDESEKPKKPISRSKLAEKSGTTAWSPGHPRVPS
ncbi:cilium assembly protein DZIP1L isoform X3 [Talpa occidentalis]|uniref:cilium assembly protein DZIP1L isoform X3 n=1 Tax=Talpa occidentalis TaxID=50954 RepID=UPI0023F649A9|nr:cilium assembly protein DZIP1L isoform X3 [Talpa occidentalis]